jgi:formylglycine-generating enzyme required for sulfatase activity
VACSDVAAPGVGYSCGSCPSGYAGNGQQCEPIDPCTEGTHDCTGALSCVFTGPGEHACVCHSGTSCGGSCCAAGEACDTTGACCDTSACVPGGGVWQDLGCGGLVNCADWVRIDGGTFDMGRAAAGPSSQPVHTVVVDSFELMREELTVAQYAECVAAGSCVEPTSSSGSCNWGVAGRDEHPLNCLSWQNARDVCAWMGGRLPSEAKWEYAARSRGEDARYPWGDDAPSCALAMGWEYASGDDTGCDTGATAEGCSRTAGNTQQDLCDMAGNVAEIMEDAWHDNYTGAPMDGSAWVEASWTRMVTRGGGYATDVRSGWLETTARRSEAKDIAGPPAPNVGVRCMRQPGGAPECANDGDCPSGYACESGQCQACVSDGQCGPSCGACSGQTPSCGGQDSGCVCSEDSCGDYRRCIAGSCAFCNGNNACGADCTPCGGSTPWCTASAGTSRCVECRGSYDCGPAERCVSGSCAPTPCTSTSHPSTCSGSDSLVFCRDGILTLRTCDALCQELGYSRGDDCVYVDVWGYDGCECI